MWLCLRTVIIFDHNSWDVSSGGKKNTRVGRGCKESERLILVLWSVIIGDDNGGALLRRSGRTTATRWEHHHHCNCSVVRGCWMENTLNVMWFQWTSGKPGSSHIPCFAYRLHANSSIVIMRKDCFVYWMLSTCSSSILTLNGHVNLLAQVSTHKLNTNHQRANCFTHCIVWLLKLKLKSYMDEEELHMLSMGHAPLIAIIMVCIETLCGYRLYSTSWYWLNSSIIAKYEETCQVFQPKAYVGVQL